MEPDKEGNPNVSDRTDKIPTTQLVGTVKGQTVTPQV
jgi:hypothetical protein